VVFTFMIVRSRRIVRSSRPLNGSAQDDYTKHDPSGDRQIPYLGTHPRAGLDVRDQMLAVVEHGIVGSYWSRKHLMNPGHCGTLITYPAHKRPTLARVVWIEREACR